MRSYHKELNGTQIAVCTGDSMTRRAASGAKGKTDQRIVSRAALSVRHNLPTIMDSVRIARCSATVVVRRLVCEDQRGAGVVNVLLGGARSNGNLDLGAARGSFGMTCHVSLLDIPQYLI